MEGLNNKNQNEGNSPQTIHEAFTAYMAAGTQAERARILSAWLSVVTSFDELMEFMDWISADSPVLTRSPLAEQKLDHASYEEIYRKMSDKIVDIQLADVAKVASVEEIKELYERMDPVFSQDGEKEIPTLRKWLELAVTKPELEELLEMMEDDFGDLPIAAKLKTDIQKKLELFD